MRFGEFLNDFNETLHDQSYEYKKLKNHCVDEHRSFGEFIEFFLISGKISEKSKYISEQKFFFIAWYQI